VSGPRFDELCTGIAQTIENDQQITSLAVYDGLSPSRAQHDNWVTVGWDPYDEAIASDLGGGDVEITSDGGGYANQIEATDIVCTLETPIGNKPAASRARLGNYLAQIDAALRANPGCGVDGVMWAYVASYRYRATNKDGNPGLSVRFTIRARSYT
jgi:hypothetical protein